MTDDPDQEATPPEVLVGPGGGAERTPLRDRWQRQPVRVRAVSLPDPDRPSWLAPTGVLVPCLAVIVVGGR